MSSQELHSIAPIILTTSLQYRRYESNRGIGIDYLQKGEDPKFLIIGNQQGLETGIAQAGLKALFKYESTMADFVYIPFASQSAVSIRRRENAWGFDTNRQFKEGTNVPEVREMMDLLVGFARRGVTFKLCLNLHEHVAFSYEEYERMRNSFYLYDTQNWEGTRWLGDIRREVTAIGLHPYTGVDDPDDPDLGLFAVAGYIFQPVSDMKPDAGFIEQWAIPSGFLERMVYCEVQSLVDQKVKDRLAQLMFRHLLFGGDPATVEF